MWFWSVSLSDQLSGQFLIFLGWPKKIAQSQRPGNFLSTLLNFLSSLFWKLVTLWYLDWKKNEESEQNMNCPVSETAQFFFLAEQKNRNWPDNWSAKRLTKTTWTSLDGSIFVSQTKKKITWLVAQDWPKPHGRPYYLNSRDLTFSSKFCQIYSSRHSGLFFVEKMVVCYFPILGLQYIDQFIHQF